MSSCCSVYSHYRVRLLLSVQSLPCPVAAQCTCTINFEPKQKQTSVTLNFQFNSHIRTLYVFSTVQWQHKTNFTKTEVTNRRNLQQVQTASINPLLTNGLSHPYHLDESTFNFRGIRSDFSFLFHFSMTIMSANKIAPDGTPRFAASHPGLFCLPMSHKKDARLI